MKHGKNYKLNLEKTNLRKKLVCGAGMRVSSPVLWPVGYNSISLALTLGVRIPRSYKHTVAQILKDRQHDENYVRETSQADTQETIGLV